MRLIQELSHEDHLASANSLLMAGVQGGWLLAGAFVGFVYNRIGLGGVLLIDFATYVVSFLCYFGVREGRHVVKPAENFAMPEHLADNPMRRYFHEMRESFSFIRAEPRGDADGHCVVAVHRRDAHAGGDDVADQRPHPACGRGGLRLAELRLGDGRVHQRGVCGAGDHAAWARGMRSRCR